MKKFVFSLAFFATVASAHVRQRYFLQGTTQGEGIESIIHWNFASPVSINMHQFSGRLSNSTEAAGVCSVSGVVTECIDFADAQDVMGDSLSEWSGTLVGGLVANLNISLTGGKPTPTSNSCEVASSSAGDGVNNIIFATKRNTSCSYSLGSGTIGLTRIRYLVTNGEIVEADLQFDDSSYRFVTTGANDLAAVPSKIINLRDVVTHEFGHFMGLDHSSVRNASMLFTVADGLSDAETDDKMGILSLYPPADLNSGVGQLRGSVMTDTASVFGGVVFALDARTLRVSASEMTNVDGAFQFCAIPAGPKILFANRYKPFGRNIQEYYSGTGDQVTVSDANGCFNPACSLMTQTLAHSWFMTNSNVGANLKVVKVQAGVSASYANISASTSDATYTEPATVAPYTTLEIDQPKLGYLGSGSVPLNGVEATRGPHIYQFTASAANMQIRTASLGIYGRLELTPVLYESDATTVVGSCTLMDPVPNLASTSVYAPELDPWLDCTGLTPTSDYVLKISGDAIHCNEIPGNSSNCAAGVESASTSAPYYIVNVFETADLNDTTLAGVSLDPFSNEGSRWLYMPTCGAKTASIVDTSRQSGETGGGCCGSLAGPDAPDPLKSLLLAILLSPVSWFILWWGSSGRRRRL